MSGKEEGVTSVELAMTISVFMLVILAMVQIALVGSALLSLQHAVAEAARDGSLTTETAAATRVSSMVAQATKRIGTGVDASGVSITICPMTNPSCSVNDPARTNQFLLITASLPFKMFWSAGTVTLTATAIARNEPA